MRASATTPGTQAGFSMVEMVMVALIMAIGILGVASLQLMSLKAASGSQNLTTATLIGDRLLDQVEEEARLTWLNQTSTQVAPVAGSEPPSLYYLAQTPPFTLPAQGFDVKGNALPASTANPIFKAVVSGKAVITSGATTGTLMDVSVTVQFTDSVTPTKTVNRSVTLARRILHA